MHKVNELEKTIENVWPQSVIEYADNLLPNWRDILSVRSNGSLSFTRYGNFGGPGHHNWEAGPIDALDLCFMFHDMENLETQNDDICRTGNLDGPLQIAIQMLQDYQLIVSGTGASTASMFTCSIVFNVLSEIWRLVLSVSRLGSSTVYLYTCVVVGVLFLAVITSIWIWCKCPPKQFQNEKDRR